MGRLIARPGRAVESDHYSLASARRQTPPVEHDVFISISPRPLTLRHNTALQHALSRQ